MRKMHHLKIHNKIYDMIYCCIEPMKMYHFCKRVTVLKGECRSSSQTMVSTKIISEWNINTKISYTPLLCIALVYV